MAPKKKTPPTERTVLRPENQLWRRQKTGMKEVTPRFSKFLRKFDIDEQYMYRLSKTKRPQVEPWINGAGFLLGIILHIGTFPYSNKTEEDCLTKFAPEIFRYLKGLPGPVPDIVNRAADFRINDYYVSHVVDAYYSGEYEWYVMTFCGKEIRFADFDSYECKRYPAKVRDLMDKVYKTALYDNRLSTDADKERYRIYEAKRQGEKNLAAMVAQRAQNVGSGLNTGNNASQLQLNGNPGPSKARNFSQNQRNENVTPKSGQMTLRDKTSVSNSVIIPNHSGNSSPAQSSAASMASHSSEKPYKVVTKSISENGLIKLKLKVYRPPKVQSGKICDPTLIARAIAGQDMPVEHPAFFYPNGPVNEFMKVSREDFHVPDKNIPRNRDGKRESEKDIDFSVSDELKSYHDMDWEQSSSSISNEQQIETAISSISEPNNLVPVNYFGSFGGQGNAGGISPNLNTVVQFPDEQEMAVSQIPWD